MNPAMHALGWACAGVLWLATALGARYAPGLRAGAETAIARAIGARVHASRGASG